MMRLLVVEDDPTISEPLVVGLTREGFDVDLAVTGAAALAAPPAEMVLLDLGLPDLDGRVVCQELRRRSSVPIIVVSARGDEIDRVMLLELGADDYVVKPFQMEEILARLNALLRRAAGFAKPRLEFGPINLDLSAKLLTVNGEKVDLTAYEYKMLEYLMLHPGQVISKSELTEHLYAQDYDRDSNVLEVFIRRLRQKLDPDQTLNPIETVRGQGYRFCLT